MPEMERLELAARAGRAVLTSSGRPADVALPPELHAALEEWARIAPRLSTPAAARRGRCLAARVTDATGRPVDYLGAPDAEPTPWATGLPVSAAATAVVVVALVALAEALVEIGEWAAVGATVLATAGLAPSVWLGRRTPVWRWVAYGVGTGLAVTWVTVTASLLL